MVKVGLKFVGSARRPRHARLRQGTDGHARDGRCFPGISAVDTERALVHITSNFSCTNNIDRAIDIIEAGGLVSIKAHAVKKVFGYVADDGLDLAYRNFLDLLLKTLEDRYGDETLLDVDGRYYPAGVLGPCRENKEIAMIDISINPENMEGVYLECLNKCFVDWGGMETYRWCFDRRLGNRKPDIMILKKGDTILGGSAVTYRHAIINEKMAVIAIMTGSWTLPEARNQGCFTTIIDQSLILARAADAALLIAFVTRKNPSMKRLVNKGSGLFPTHYCVAGQAMAPTGVVGSIDSRYGYYRMFPGYPRIYGVGPGRAAAFCVFSRRMAVPVHRKAGCDGISLH